MAVSDPLHNTLSHGVREIEVDETKLHMYFKDVSDGESLSLDLAAVGNANHSLSMVVQKRMVPDRIYTNIQYNRNYLVCST